jgi:hypothetical protein
VYLVEGRRELDLRPLGWFAHFQRCRIEEFVCIKECRDRSIELEEVSQGLSAEFTVVKFLEKLVLMNLEIAAD